MFEKTVSPDMCTPLVSVVVPVYNVENYIERCLESIVHQTYQNLEIILVNDGTLDRSAEICEEYAKDDSRIKVYHKENGGLSDARNHGIEHSTGEYITFIDSDDYVDLDYIECLMNLLEGGKYRMSICSIYDVYTASGKVVNQGNGEKICLNAQDAMEKMCYHDEVDTCAYAKMMHRSLFDQVRFPMGKCFEDIGTTYLLFDLSKQINCWFVPKYYYMIRDDSIVTSSFTPAKLDLLEMTDQMAEYVNDKYPELKKATLRRQVYARFSTLNQMLDVKSKEWVAVRKSIVGYIKRNAENILKDRKAPRRDKVAIRCLRLGLPLYRLFWRRYLKIQRG